MDLQTIINIVVGLCGALGGFILRATWEDLKEMRLNLAAFKDFATETYMRKDDFRDALREVRDVMARIEAKLDHKADK